MTWSQATAALSARGFRQYVIEDGREEWRHPDGSLAVLWDDGGDGWVFAVFPADVVWCR